MSKALSALIIEDSVDDTFTVVRELQRGGFDVEFERVDTLDQLRTALEAKTWDIFISDQSMPHLSGTRALSFIKAQLPNTPFIIISGTISEDAAVEAMKVGADDYMSKGNIGRLVPAVQRELRKAEIRKKNKLKLKLSFGGSKAVTKNSSTRVRSGSASGRCPPTLLSM